MFKFLLAFFIDITTPVISSTQIARDVNVNNMQFINFFLLRVFSVDHFHI